MKISDIQHKKICEAIQIPIKALRIKDATSGIIDLKRDLSELEARMLKEINGALDLDMVDSTWLPMETAPKDGTLIDIWDKDGYRRCDVKYVYPMWITEKEGLGVNPSHWMPRPKQPKANDLPTQDNVIEVEFDAKVTVNQKLRVFNKLGALNGLLDGSVTPNLGHGDKTPTIVNNITGEILGEIISQTVTGSFDFS